MSTQLLLKNKKLHLSSAGFSLIELMIVIAIIGILAVIAIPSYRNYTQRARFAEVVSAAETFKTAVALAIQQGVPLAELVSGAHGIPVSPAATKNLNTIEVDGGTITATGTDLVDNHTYILTPTPDGSVWNISGSCLDKGLCNA